MHACKVILEFSIITLVSIGILTRTFEKSSDKGLCKRDLLGPARIQNQ